MKKNRDIIGIFIVVAMFILLVVSELFVGNSYKEMIFAGMLVLIVVLFIVIAKWKNKIQED